MVMRHAYARYLDSECKVKIDSKLAKRLCRELIDTLIPILSNLLNNLPGNRQDDWTSFNTNLVKAIKKAVKLRSE